MIRVLRCFTLTTSRNRFIVLLERATLVYLGLPALLWIVGWLRWHYSVPLCLALVGAGIAASRQTRAVFLPERGPCPPGASLPLWALVAAACLGILWGLFSGAGGFSAMNPDWDKHLAVLRDLVEGEWPIVYARDGGAVPLIYYFGYYLPAALVGKFFGWWGASFAMLVWTCAGVVIAMFWFVLFAERKPLLAGFYFIFANGLDFFGQRLLSGIPLQNGTEHLDWWSGWLFLNFPGHYSQLNWAPQHSLAAWSIAGLIAVQLPHRKDVGHLGFLAALAALWSPFTAIGLVPLIAAATLYHRGRGVLHPVNLSIVPYLLVILLYFSATTVNTPHGWHWTMFNVRDDWMRFFIFHLFEWGVFFLFARDLRRSEDPGLRWLFWAAGATLFATTFYRLGIFNDWCMRTSIPALLLIWAGTARSMLRPPYTTETRILVLLALMGSFGALHESARSWFPLRWQPSPIDERVHVPHLEPAIATQYLGRDTAFFFKHLAKSSAPVELGPPPLHAFPPISPTP